jgi:hypothetical protein
MSDEEKEMTVDDYAKAWMDAAIANFKKDGEVMTTAILPTKEALVFIPMHTFCEQWGTEMGKIAFGAAVRKIANEGEGVDFVGMSIESWSAKLDMNDHPDHEDAQKMVEELYDKHGSMANWPQEFVSEMLMVSVESRDGDCATYACEINQETRELAEPEKLDAGMTGRMTNWFGARPNPEEMH